MDEIDAFFAGATTWDILIMLMICLVLYKFIKKALFFIVILVVGYYAYQYFGSG